MIKIGMNLLLWTDHVTAAQDPVLERLKAIGFDSVEVPVFATDNLADYERLGQRLKALGLAATAVTVSTPDANPISPDPAVRAAAVERLSRVLECCHAFGCETLVGPLHSALGQFSGEAPTADEFQRGVETLRKVAEVAQSKNIRLAVEYLNRFENYFLTTAADTLAFVKAVDHPACRMMFDSFHAHIEEKSQADAINSCIDHVIHFHVSENDRGTPGTGQVDWNGYFQAIRSAPQFRGHLTIEAFGRALPALAAATRVWRDLFPDAMDLCKQGHAFIKSQLP